MVEEESCKFIYYFMTFGVSIHGYAHIKKVVDIDDTHLSGKYQGLLLSAIAQDIWNHIYRIVYCVVDKVNNTSWDFFFEKLKSVVIDKPELSAISEK